MSEPFSREELDDFGPVPTYTGRNLDEIAFPLGGIGTGMIRLGGWGQLRDWEIMNRPALGFVIPDSFFALKVERAGAPAAVRLLQGPVGGSYTFDGHHPDTKGGEGLPRFESVSFTGRFPFAEVNLSDGALGVDATLTAWNPFIPLDPDDSGIPVAILEYAVTNRGTDPAKLTVFGTLGNVIGGGAAKDHVAEPRSAAAGGGESPGTGAAVSGAYLSTTAVGPDDPRFGSMVLATTASPGAVTPRWNSKRLSRYWAAICESEAYAPGWTGTSLGKGEVATVSARAEVAPGATAGFTFLIAWHFPNYLYDPSERIAAGSVPGSVWRNYCATRYADAWEVAADVGSRLPELRRRTRAFHDALLGSTLPAYVLDGVSAQLSTLKSTTCLRLEDGTFYGFEGSDDTAGACEGSCSHVWGYAQSHAWLFPTLAQSMRRAEYRHAMHDDGFVQFRLPLPLGSKPEKRFYPAADGQMAGVIQVYREWLLCGSDEWLREMWPAAKKALEFAWVYWDRDRDGVPEGLQHVTWDTEIYGPNSFVGSLYLCALRAGAEMAEATGDEESAARYRELADRGARWSDEHLFNGDYYEQIVEPEAHRVWPDELRKITERRGPEPELPWPRWQYGKGCIADQLLGQWHADLLDLGDLYDPAHIDAALASIFRHNWKRSVADHAAFDRINALGNESALLLGTWPRGECPEYPFYFAPEVWPGVEYTVASFMIMRGMVDEGLSIVLGLRRRFRGDRRNPWGEWECGRHYARSLSSFALIPALSGFHYSAPEKRLSLAPRIRQGATDTARATGTARAANAGEAGSAAHAEAGVAGTPGAAFRTFFCVASAWGEIEVRRDGGIRVDVVEGELALTRIELDGETLIEGETRVVRPGQPLDLSGAR